MSKELNKFIHDMHQFKFDVKPVAQARARAGRYGFYTPSKSAKFKKDIQAVIKREFKDYPLTCPLMVEVTFHFIPAKSNKKTYHTKKPDCDNLAKGILDACNKLLFIDDSQVVHLIVSKVYSDKECVYLNVFELSEG